MRREVAIDQRPAGQRAVAESRLNLRDGGFFETEGVGWLSERLAAAMSAAASDESRAHAVVYVASELIGRT